MNGYSVTLLDRSGQAIASDLVDTLKDAKARAIYMLSQKFAKTVESSHYLLDTWKVEIHHDEVVIWDRFLN